MNLEVKNTAVQFLIKQIRVKGTEKEMCLKHRGIWVAKYESPQIQSQSGSNAGNLTCNLTMHCNYSYLDNRATYGLILSLSLLHPAFLAFSHTHTHARALDRSHCPCAIVLSGSVCIHCVSFSPLTHLPALGPLSSSVPHKQPSIRQPAPLCSNVIVLARSPSWHLSHTCSTPLMGRNLTPAQITQGVKIACPQPHSPND